MRALATIGLLLGLAACGSGATVNRPPPCTEDAQCAEGQICFPDGCGDPGSNLFVEITANTRSGLHAQDFGITDGSLRPVYDVELFAPMSLTGEVSRDGSPNGDPALRTLYSEPFSVRAVGESALIPGVVRTFEQTFTKPERGAFSMPIAAGRYTVTATSADTSIPPMARSGVQVDNGGNTQVSFTFPSIDGARVITGRLLEHIEPGVPPVEIPLTQTAMELQAIDPATKRPLSQWTYTSSGLSGSRGDFVLSIDPAVDLLPTFQIVARPRDAAALVPTRTFTLGRPFPKSTVLQMGDFGEPLSGLVGEVVGTDGAPVVGASVFLEGAVTGGGTFKSRTVRTDSSGQFVVDVLPSPYDGAYTVTVLPLAKSGAGILTMAARAVPKPSATPVLEPARFVCPDKLGVVGAVVRPDPSATPASQVLLVATAVKSIDGRPLPTEPTEAVTDESGQFRFSLDPAVYRFDFLPGADLPRMSRYVTVRADADPDAGASGAAKTVDLKDFTLSKGRQVTGHVTSQPYPNMTQAEVVNATLRFFRLTQIDDKPGAQVLGEAVTDARGFYGVVLPTR